MSNDKTEDSTPVENRAEASLIEPTGEDNKVCEVCGAPVLADERHEVLRADGPRWRHDWHTEPV